MTRRTRLAITMAVVTTAWAMSQLATAAPATQLRTAPIGTQLDLLLGSELTSKAAKVDDPFEASTIIDVKQGGQVLIPAGAIARGFVGSVRASTQTNHQGQLTLSFDELRIGEQAVKLRASVVAVLNPKRRPSATRDGAPIDLADPGTMSPLAGVVVSPGGSLMSMMAGDVLLPLGAVLRIRLDRAIEIKTTSRAEGR